jgi:hypothetical protein
MHWPSDNEWFQILVLISTWEIWRIARDCRKYLKSIATSFSDPKPEGKKGIAQ